MTDSALILPIPEAEPVVEDWRARYDESAALGLPAHITLLYPLMGPDACNARHMASIGSILSETAPLEFSLIDLRRFPNVLYLAPEPANGLAALIDRLCAEFPDWPRYGDPDLPIVPHLTVCHVKSAEGFEEAAAAAERTIAPQLPVKAYVPEARMMENSTGRWKDFKRFGLGGHAA